MILFKKVLNYEEFLAVNSASHHNRHKDDYLFSFALKVRSAVKDKVGI